MEICFKGRRTLDYVYMLNAQGHHIVDEQLCKLRYFCNQDAGYKMITEHVQKGFHKDAINIPDTLMPYHKAQDDLYLDFNGFLYHKNILLYQLVSERPTTSGC